MVVEKQKGVQTHYFDVVGGNSSFVISKKKEQRIRFNSYQPRDSWDTVSPCATPPKPRL